MTEPNEPKKETTRIPVTAEGMQKQSESSAKSRDTVRIQLPVHEAPVHILTKPQSAVQQPSAPQFPNPPQPLPVPLNATVTPAPELPSTGLPKETVRIPLPTVQARKTQPLVAMPGVAPQTAPVAVARKEPSSMSLWWVLLGISALILLIQIWTYLS
ncbi:MAG TPA: hypothetical protein VFA51_05805 [Candidatus Udaeobacter sp.]|nr:hypothetical protein [Candidatus Udaeobacter sp.]